MNDSLAISISNLSKSYTKETDRSKNAVLKNINFNVKMGELVSIVGSNGSGKSTLLSILSGLVKPDDGIIEIQGKLVAILENGSNFHQDLVGSENAEMFFRLNQVPASEIPELLVKAKEFSGLGEFFEQSIKYYSQGMFIRLAVSVAFLIDADIYLFDEVLSAGDDAFRKKIEILIKDFIRKGKCIIFASHNKQEVVNYSNRTLWIEMGELRMDDKPQQVMPAYVKFQKLRLERDLEDSVLKKLNEVITPLENEDDLAIDFNEDEYGNEKLQFHHIQIKGLDAGHIYREEEIKIQFWVFKKEAGYSISCQIKVKDEFDQAVFFALSIYNAEDKDLASETEDYIGELNYTCSIPKKFLASGIYFLSIFIGKNSKKGPAFNERVYAFPKLIAFKVQSKNYEFISDPEHFSVNPALSWKIERKN